MLLYKDVIKDKNKFFRKWKGPYRILRLRRPNVILGSVDGKEKIIKTHVSKLKRFVGPAILPLRKIDNPRPHLRDPNLESTDDQLSDSSSAVEEEKDIPAKETSVTVQRHYYADKNLEQSESE